MNVAYIVKPTKTERDELRALVKVREKMGRGYGEPEIRAPGHLRTAALAAPIPRHPVQAPGPVALARRVCWMRWTSCLGSARSI